MLFRSYTGRRDICHPFNTRLGFHQLVSIFPAYKHRKIETQPYWLGGYYATHLTDGWDFTNLCQFFLPINIGKLKSICFSPQMEPKHCTIIDSINKLNQTRSDDDDDNVYGVPNEPIVHNL